LYYTLSPKGRHEESGERERRKREFGQTPSVPNRLPSPRRTAGSPAGSPTAVCVFSTMSNVLDEIFSSDSTPKVTASDLEGFSIDDLLEGTTPVNKVDVMENQKPSSVAPSLNDVDEEFADIFGTSTSPERSVEIPSKAAAATSTNHLDFLAWLDAADDPDASNTVASSDNEIGIDTELVANATINDSDSWISRDPAQALEEMAQAETGKVNVEQMRR
jgi:hypothetical protein